MEAIQFRKAQPGDLAIMQEIAKRTIDGSYPSFLGDEGVDSFINSGESDRELQKHIESCDVALSEDAIVGFAIYFDDLIHLMKVDVFLHHLGIGSPSRVATSAGLVELDKDHVTDVAPVSSKGPNRPPGPPGSFPIDSSRTTSSAASSSTLASPSTSTTGPSSSKVTKV